MHKPIRSPSPKDVARFLARADQSSSADGCWLWTGMLNPNGYGMVSIDKRQFLAHRVSLCWLTGVDPGDLYACHRCDNPPCVNPAHLYAGTPMDNMRDMQAKGRRVFGAPRVWSPQLSPRDLAVAHHMKEQGRKLADLADFFGITRGEMIREIANGQPEWRLESDIEHVDGADSDLF